MTIPEVLVRTVVLVAIGCFVMLHRVGGVWIVLQRQVLFVLIAADVCVAAAMSRGGTLVLVRRVFSTVVVCGASVFVLVAMAQAPLFVVVVLFVSAFVLHAAGCVVGWIEVVGVGLLLPVLLSGVGLVLEQVLGESRVDWHVRFGVCLVVVVFVDSWFGFRRWWRAHSVLPVNAMRDDAGAQR